MTSLEELQAQMATALASGNAKAIEEIAEQIVKGKSDRRKQEALQIAKEAEELAQVREELAKKIHKSLGGSEYDKLMVDVKAWGFTYKIDRANPSEPDVSYKSVSLLTQQVKAKVASGNGGAGKTKDEFGMSLGEVYEKFATDADRAALVEAEVKDKTASDKLGKVTNSNQWRVKNDVKKRALSEGLLAPAK